jgi:hypothetical protein
MDTNLGHMSYYHQVVMPNQMAWQNPEIENQNEIDVGDPDGSDDDDENSQSNGYTMPVMIGQPVMSMA